MRIKCWICWGLKRIHGTATLFGSTCWLCDGRGFVKIKGITARRSQVVKIKAPKRLFSFLVILGLLGALSACGETAAPRITLTAIDDCPPAVMHGSPAPRDTVIACFRCHAAPGGEVVFPGCPELVGRGAPR